MSSLGRTVKMLRVGAGIKQRAFADRVGVTQAYLSALEADKRKPSLDLVERMATELGVPPGALLSFDIGAGDVPPQYGAVLAKLQELQQLLMQLQVQGDAKGETTP